MSLKQTVVLAVLGATVGTFFSARGGSHDSTTVHAEGPFQPGDVVWSEHSPESEGDIRQLGFTASADGPGPSPAVASYVVRADGVEVCAVSVPCSILDEQHLHADCGATPVPAAAHVELLAGVSGCTGGAFPEGHVTPRFFW